MKKLMYYTQGTTLLMLTDAARQTMEAKQQFIFRKSVFNEYRYIQIILNKENL
jgi:hypothetical protein